MKMNNYKIVEPKLNENLKEKYDKLLKIYNLLKLAKEYWFTKPSNNKTADLIMDIDVKLFGILYNLEKGIDEKVNFRKDELSKCFRIPNLKTNEDTWKLHKQQALEIYDSL